jgi:hypothetical protein
MKKNYRICKPFQLSSTVFMLLALLWLTISLPFANAAQQVLNADKTTTTASTTDETSADNPLTNSSEEKAPGTSGSSLSEEYLHHSDDLIHENELFLGYHMMHTVDEYMAFHGEMLCPPPNMHC